MNTKVIESSTGACPALDQLNRTETGISMLKQSKAKRTALKVALIYVIGALCWDLFSDDLLKYCIRNPDLRDWIDITVDGSLVILTGWLLYQMLCRWLKKWDLDAQGRERAEAAQQQSEERYR